MKIHLGCGCVYLKDYVNVDAFPNYIIPNVPQKFLKQNTTTFDNYYKHGFNEGSHVCVADVAATLDKLPFKDGSSEEVILFHVLEHIPLLDVGIVLKEIYRVLKKGGKFIVAVPDTKETARKLAEAETEEDEEWYIRLLYGTQRNKWSHHYCGYTGKSLKELLLKYNFDNFEDLPNINFYPAIHLQCKK